MIVTSCHVVCDVTSFEFESVTVNAALRSGTGWQNSRKNDEDQPAKDDNHTNRLSQTAKEK